MELSSMIFRIFVSSPLQLNGEVHEIEAADLKTAYNQIKETFTHFDGKQVDQIYDENGHLVYHKWMDSKEIK